MSLVTRCTSCGTVFRVVQDQLKVSSGWVRCGKCGEVFNALQTLFDLERDQRDTPEPATSFAASSAARAAATASAPASDLGEREPSARPAWAASGGVYDSGYDRAEPVAHRTSSGFRPRGQTADGAAMGALGHREPWVEPHPDQMRASHADAAATAMAAEMATALARSDASSDAHADASALADEPGLHRDALAEQARSDELPPGEVDLPISILPEDAADTAKDAARDERSAGASVWPSEHSHSRWIEPDEESETDNRLHPGDVSDSRQLVPHGASVLVETPEFLRTADRQGLWSTPLARGLMSFAALALLLLLLGQMAVHERDRVADASPSLRPLLAQWCRVAGCELLEAPRRLDAFTVESTSLTRAPGLADAYRLTITVRNRASGPATLPSVELALTDPDGQLVARRVLNPADFRIQRAVIPAGGETTLQLVFTSRKGRVNGYTVDLFYP
jgi:predicted Zn finger-like uncharacterized protein